MDRFKQFSELFANFPTLQKDLSVSDKDKPAVSNGMCSVCVLQTRASSLSSYLVSLDKQLHLPNEPYHQASPARHCQTDDLLAPMSGVIDHRTAHHEAQTVHRRDQLSTVGAFQIRP